MTPWQSPSLGALGRAPVLGFASDPDLTPWQPVPNITNGQMLLLTPPGQDAFGNPLPVTPSMRSLASGASDNPAQGISVLATQASPVGQYALPGIAPTYLDPQFADRIGAFLTDLQNQNISPRFLSGYRDPAKQASLQSDRTAVTPAKDSLHSAGLAVDIDLGPSADQATRNSIIAAAARAGLSWGGNFSKPDPNHFYFDPGGNRQQNINNFSAGVQTLNNQIPD